MVAQKLQINYKKLQKLVWQCTLLINETMVQQNRIRSLHHNRNSSKQKRTSPVVSTNRQLPNSL